MTKNPHIRLICLLTMLSGVGLLSGCGLSTATESTPAVTATPAATATPATTTYTSADGQYTLQYPTGWAIKLLTSPRSSGIVQLGDSTGNEQFLIEPLTVQIVPDYPVLLKDALTSTSDFQNAKVDATTTTASYPSGVWTVASATVVLDGDPSVARLYGTVHSGRSVLIMTYAIASSDATDQTTYFVPMLTSFTFLK